MAWGKNGTPSTLDSIGDVMTISDLTVNKFNVFLQHSPYDTSWVNPSFTFNNDTGSLYALRANYNGGSDGTSVSQAAMIQDGSGTADDKFIVGYVVAISGEEKLLISHLANNGTAGAGNTPNRTETVGKYVPSPLTDTIDRIDSTNASAGSYAVSSNLSALGSDITPAAAIPFAENAQTGSRAEITDTRKMYHRDDVDFKEENGNEATNYRSASWYEQLSGETP